MIINIKSYRFYFILISILIILSDQLTKYIINLNHTSLINNDLIFWLTIYFVNWSDKIINIDIKIK